MKLASVIVAVVTSAIMTALAPFWLAIITGLVVGGLFFLATIEIDEED